MMAPLVAKAQDTTTGTTDTTGTTGTDTMGAGSSTDTMGTGASVAPPMSMSAEPVMVSGNVLRYYVDRSGYVTAMDVQTDNGVRMVSFAPGMAQRISTMYPVGQKANVWVQGNGMAGSNGRVNVVGLGEAMPRSMMQPYTASAVDLLESEPYIQTGSRLMSVRGRLHHFVVADNGEILGMVIDRSNHGQGMMRMMNTMSSGATTTDMSTTSTSSDTTGTGTGTTGTDTTTTTTDTTSSTTTTAPAAPMVSEVMWTTPDWVLVRIPREMRHISPGYAGPRRAGAFKNAKVEVTGYEESPRYGAMTPYSGRILASALVLNGLSVGPLGFGTMNKDQTRTLFKTNFMGTKGMSQEEMQAGQMGYTTYTPMGTMSETTMGSGGTSTGGMGTGEGMGTGTGSGDSTTTTTP